MSITNPDKSIKDTGERMIPSYHKGHQVYGEHITRYSIAKNIVEGKVVLDIASGSGYGTKELATTAKKVYGVDINSQAIKYAKKNYQNKNIEFIEGSATKIPIPDNTLDVVISFETIEHIEDYKKFMVEIKRVLKKDGILILSTPNDVEFPEDNHFHVHEFQYNELQKLVKKYFINVENYYQATWTYNAIFTEDKLSSEWEDKVNTINTAPIKKDKCIYFYMLCSNRKINEKLESISAISEHFSARKIQEYEKSIRQHIDEQGKIIKHLENELKSSHELGDNLQKELDRIKNRPEWRIYKKIRKPLGKNDK